MSAFGGKADLIWSEQISAFDQSEHSGNDVLPFRGPPACRRTRAAVLGTLVRTKCSEPLRNGGAVPVLLKRNRIGGQHEVDQIPHCGNLGWRARRCGRSEFSLRPVSLRLLPRLRLRVRAKLRCARLYLPGPGIRLRLRAAARMLE